MRSGGAPGRPQPARRAVGVAHAARRRPPALGRLTGNAATRPRAPPPLASPATSRPAPRGRRQRCVELVPEQCPRQLHRGRLQLADGLGARQPDGRRTGRRRSRRRPADGRDQGLLPARARALLRARRMVRRPERRRAARDDRGAPAAAARRAPRPPPPCRRARAQRGGGRQRLRPAVRDGHAARRRAPDPAAAVLPRRCLHARPRHQLPRRERPSA
jgi:hypothetical protein